MGWRGPSHRRTRGPSGRRSPNLPLGRCVTVVGPDDAPGRGPSASPAVPRPVERSDRRPGRSGARVGRCPRRGRDHLASGRLRRGGGSGCLIRALGARPRATGPRLGPACPLGSRASAKADKSSLRPAWHHQVGGRPHGPSGRRRGRAGRLEAPLGRDAPPGPGGPRRPLGPPRSPSRLAASPTRRGRPWAT